MNLSVKRDIIQLTGSEVTLAVCSVCHLCSLCVHSWGEKVQPYICGCCNFKALHFEDVLKPVIFLRV